jgi:hypothetical protein
MLFDLDSSKKLGKLLLLVTISCQQAIATPIWHCSRSDVQIANASDDFTLAALTFEREVIRISLRDLYEAYQGAGVKMSGNLPLSVCVIGGDSPLSSTAMSSLGSQTINTKSLITLSVNSATSGIFVIEDEAAMEACITRHHPAVGYLSKVSSTKVMGPCF